MNEKSSTTMSSRHKKRGIIIGCAIGGVAAIALSVGLGVGLTSCGHIKKFETGEKFGN
ncbi:hypothetical protein FACS1894166_11710 [Bacilli bacterium]|nr:hypothetical protein FACS1894166_11710 [Bacilli bacterium]